MALLGVDTASILIAVSSNPPASLALDTAPHLVGLVGWALARDLEGYLLEG